MPLLAVAAAACVTGAGPSTTSSRDDTGTDPVPATTAGPSPSTTAAQDAATITSVDLSGLEGVNDEMRAKIEELMVEAQEIRGLPFLSTPNITVVSDAELKRRVREMVEEGSEDFPADGALYKLLGLLDPEADFETIILDAYLGQVAGFYDEDTEEIVVLAQADGFTLLQEGTVLHELVHALTDQHFGFSAKMDRLLDEQRFDQAAAYLALIEGDATLVTVKWIRTLSGRRYGQFLAELQAADTSALDAAPPFLADTLIFPYDSGFRFVEHLEEAGGWEAVNDAYLALPGVPGSTEQVISPGDYRRDLPVEVEILDLEIPGYTIETTSVWGEQGLRVLLDQTVGARAGAVAADGWGGDSYHQWFDGKNAAFLLVYQADTRDDLAELEDTLLDYAISTVPAEAFVWVESVDEQLFFIAADVFEIGEQIRAAVGLG